MSLVDKEVLITLTDQKQITGLVLTEDQFSITLREGPNPHYSSRPPLIVQRASIQTIQITSR